MNKRQARKGFWVWIVTVLLLLNTIMVCEAEEVERNISDTEIVFLVDTSSSMKTKDKDRLVIDAVRQTIHSLPSGYQVGLVAYDTDVQDVVPLSTDMEELETTLNSIEYKGYSNAGAGLAEAVKLFSDDADEKYIIMVSDGEIDMPGRKEREASQSMYTEAVETAKAKGIQISIGAIGTEIDTQNMECIAGGGVAFPKEEVGVTDAGGGNVHIQMPVNAERVRVILTGKTDIIDVTAEYIAESGHTIVGKRFAIVDMQRPSGETMDIHFKTEDISGAKAYLLTEYQAELKVETSYRIEELPRTEEEIKKKVPVAYEHFADITIWLADAEGNHTNLWQQERMEGKKISYTLNGALCEGFIEQGKIRTTIPADGIEKVEVTINMESETAIYDIIQPAMTEIEKYPDPQPEPQPDYRPLWMILSVLAAAMMLVIFWWIKRKNTTVIYMAPSPKQKDMKIETRNSTYSGRLAMYIVRTKEGRDIPPQTYTLFGRANGRLTLDKILTACGIKFGKIGAEDIIFYPGPDHSIVMMDQSECCTVMRGSEIMKKGMGYPVFYNEKITVTFEDEMTEMEIHYKNLKPSEREELKIR